LEQLGWKPEIGWEEGIKRTKEWYCKAENMNCWISPTESALVAHPRVGATPQLPCSI